MERHIGVSNTTNKIGTESEPDLRQSVRELADLLSDHTQWLMALVAHPQVAALLRGDGVDDAAMRQQRLELVAIHVGAVRVAERLA